MSDASKADPKCETSPPPPLPRKSWTQLTPGEWPQFFSITGGSILYCLSAMCVVWGIAELLGPLLATSDALGEALPCIGALNLYELLLLGVLVFLLVRHSVTDDAISLVVLVALFMVGSGIALGVVANSRPEMATGIGVVCFLLVAAKLFVLKRWVRLALSGRALFGLGVVLAWNLLAGASHSRSAAMIQGGRVGRNEWLVGAALLLLGGACVFLDTVWRDRPRPKPAEKQAFLYTPSMVWIISAIILAASGVHQYVLGYIFEVDYVSGDFLPLVFQISLIVAATLLTLDSSTRWAAMPILVLPLLWIAPFVIGGKVLAENCHGISVFWYPPVFFCMMAVGVLLLCQKNRSARPALLVVASLYVVAALLTLGYSPQKPMNLQWRFVGGLLTTTFFIIGVMRRRPVMCAIAVAIVALGFSTYSEFGTWASAVGLTDAGAVFLFAGAGLVAIGLAFGHAAPRWVATMGCVGLAVGLFDILASQEGILVLALCILALLVCALLWLRLRALPGVVVLLLPVSYEAWHVFTKLKSWRIVILGFLLLFAGAAASMAKAKRRGAGDGERSQVT